MPYNSQYTGLEIDRAVGTVRKREPVWESKQSKLVGTAGQIVGFDSRGNAVAQNFSNFDLGNIVTVGQFEVTLLANGWESKQQSFYIDGISVDETAQLIQPVPKSTDRQLWANAEITVDQSLNQVTFTCKEVPMFDIHVYVLVWELKSHEH